MRTNRIPPSSSPAPADMAPTTGATPTAVPALRVGPRGVVLSANDAFCELVGLEREAIVGDEPPYAWWPDDQYAWFAVQLGERLEHATGRGEFSGVVRRTDGTRIDVVGHAEADSKDPEHIDIDIEPSDGERADEPPLDAYLRRVYDANVIGMISGRDSQVLRANDAFLAIIGYSRDQFETGEIDWATLTPPEFFGLDAAAGETMVRTGSSGPIDKQYLRLDGTRVWVRVAGALLSRRPFRWISTVEDTTDEHERRIAHDTAMDGSQERIAQLTAENRQLKGALSSRIVIEQAKGRLAGELGISPSEGFELLRRRARENRTRLRDVAEQVVQQGARALPRGRARQ